MTAPEPAGIVWHTSSYSAHGGACVQVGWRTSSYSGNGGNCVQVAPAWDRVLVRDSKNPGGPALTFRTPAWRTFLTTATLSSAKPCQGTTLRDLATETRQFAD